MYDKSNKNRIAVGCQHCPNHIDDESDVTKTSVMSEHIEITQM